MCSIHRVQEPVHGRRLRRGVPPQQLRGRRRAIGATCAVHRAGFLVEVVCLYTGAEMVQSRCSGIVLALTGVRMVIFWRVARHRKVPGSDRLLHWRPTGNHRRRQRGSPRQTSPAHALESCLSTSSLVSSPAHPRNQPCFLDRPASRKDSPATDARIRRRCQDESSARCRSSPKRPHSIPRASQASGKPPTVTERYVYTRRAVRLDEELRHGWLTRVSAMPGIFEADLQSIPTARLTPRPQHSSSSVPVACLFSWQQSTSPQSLQTLIQACGEKFVPGSVTENQRLAKDSGPRIRDHGKDKCMQARSGRNLPDSLIGLGLFWLRLGVALSRRFSDRCTC